MIWKVYYLCTVMIIIYLILNDFIPQMAKKNDGEEEDTPGPANGTGDHTKI